MTDPFVQLLIIWVGVFIAVYAAKATRMTPVLYYLAIGAIAVNTGLLPHEAHPFIRGFAEIGIIVIMFALGFDESPVNFLRSVRRSWGIAFFGAIAPFAVAYSVADYFWGRHQYVDDVRSGDDRHGGITDHGVAEERRVGSLGRRHRHHDLGGY